MLFDLRGILLLFPVTVDLRGILLVFPAAVTTWMLGFQGVTLLAIVAE